MTSPTVVAASIASFLLDLLESLPSLEFRKNIFIMEERLLAKERDDPADFANKLELIELYRSQGRLDEARQVRLRLVELVPVAEEVWLEWISDDRSEEVCKKALKDFWCKAYLDPEVVLEYLRTSADGPSVFQQLVVHVRNPALWSLQRSLTHDPNEKLKLYEKQFAIPMEGLESAWKEYCALTPSRDFETLYLKTFAEWQRQRRSVEDMKLHIASGGENGFLKIVEDYVAEAPSQAHFIYEEALLGFNSLPELWESYVYAMVIAWQLDNKKVSKEAVRQLLKRAVRNCPARVDFWQLLLLTCEEMRRPVDSKRHSEWFNKALTALYDDSTAYLTLWTFYADYTRRAQQDWRAVYREGTEWLKAYVSPLHLSLKLAQAKFEDEEAARQLYEEVVKEKGDSYALWRAYLNYTEKHSEMAHTRQVYRRAVEYVKDYTAEISKEWLVWEEAFGSPADFITAKLKVYKRLKRKSAFLPVKRQREEVKKATTGDERHTAYVGGVTKSIKDNDLQEYFSQLLPVKDVRVVRSLKGESKGFAYVDCYSAEELEEFIRKFQGVELQGSILHISKSKPPAKSGRDAFTVFLNNLPYSVTEDQIRALLSQFGALVEVRIIRNANGQCRGYAYAEFETEESAAAASSLGKAQLGGRSILVKGSQSTPVEKNVVYVGNLPYTASEAALQTLFPGCSTVRMPIDPEGHSKGFAFVEFTSTALADKFLNAPTIELEGRALVLKRSSKPKQPKLANSDFAKFL